VKIHVHSPAFLVGHENSKAIDFVLREVKDRGICVPTLILKCSCDFSLIFSTL
jgi:hypothetical protein